MAEIIEFNAILYSLLRKYHNQCTKEYIRFRGAKKLSNEISQAITYYERNGNSDRFCLMYRSVEQQFKNICSLAKGKRQIVNRGLSEELSDSTDAILAELRSENGITNPRKWAKYTVE